MSATATATTRRLTIDRCELVTEGTAQDGRAWRLYRVKARDERGAPIPHELVSFEELAAGDGEFTVTRRDHDRYGASFLLRRPRGHTADRVAELERQAADHERRIAALEAAPAGAREHCPNRVARPCGRQPQTDPEAVLSPSEGLSTG